MQEMEETRKYFSQEHAVKNAKLVNLAIENRNAFCQEAFERNLRAIFGLMLDYLCTNEDTGKGTC